MNPVSCVESFGAFQGLAVFGIRTGAKTASFQIPGNLPPGPLQALLPIKVTRVESLRPGVKRQIEWGNRQYTAGSWAETLEHADDVESLAAFSNAASAFVRHGSRFYLAAWPSRELALDIAQHVLAVAGVENQAARTNHLRVQLRK